MRTITALIASCILALACQSNLARGAPQPGWYWNPDESGRGFFIESLGNLIYMAGYLYQPDGHALWVVSGGPNNDPYNYTGRLLTYNGGQVLNGPYRPPQAPQDVGAVTVRFTDDTHAVLTWAGGVAQLQRHIYGTGAPRFKPLTGWWWNPNESGRGYSIEVQGNNLFFVGFMYEPDGRPVWYFSAGPVGADASTYSGPLLQFANGQTLTGPYQPPGAPVTVGRLDVAFGAQNAGKLTFTKAAPSQDTPQARDGTQSTTDIVPEFDKPGAYVPDDWFVGTFTEEVVVPRGGTAPLYGSAKHTLTGKNLTWQKQSLDGDTFHYVLLGATVTLTVQDRTEVVDPDIGTVTCDLNATGTADVSFPFTSSSSLKVNTYSGVRLTLNVNQETLNIQGTLKCVGPGGGIIEGFAPPPFPVIPLNVIDVPAVVYDIPPLGAEIAKTLTDGGPFPFFGAYTQTVTFNFAGVDECTTAFCPRAP